MPRGVWATSGWNRVSVTHPHGLPISQPREQFRVVLDLQRRRPVLTDTPWFHSAAQRLADELVTVAETQDRHAGVQVSRLEGGLVRIVDAIRAA